jgi:hypothetical protein
MQRFPINGGGKIHRLSNLHRYQGRFVGSGIVKARHSIVSENVRPALCGVIDAQDFEGLPVHPIRHDERRHWDD